MKNRSPSKAVGVAILTVMVTAVDTLSVYNNEVNIIGYWGLITVVYVMVLKGRLLLPNWRYPGDDTKASASEVPAWS